MKMTLSPTASANAAAILAGGLLFSGPANAAVIFSEDFEDFTNAFGLNTYAYASNYTMPNVLTPPGGLLYGNAGAGINGQVSTNEFALEPLSLTTGGGVSTAQIDAGLAGFDFRAQFSTYRTQGDYGQLSITFKDAGALTIGDAVILGGDLFTASLASGQFGNYADARAWGESAFQGIVPVGARTIDVVFSGTKTAGGTAIDGYVDNVSLSVAVVPEPATFAILGFASLLCLKRRRR